MVEPSEIGPERAGEVVDVLAEAFHDYPVMRYVVGEAGADYDRRQRELVGFFVAARVLRADPVLGLEGTDGSLAAVATLVPPEAPEPPSPELEERREGLWRDLGDDARARYEAFGDATARFKPAQPHLYLSMIGVRRAAAGRGLARGLLDAVHARSERDPRSRGVALTTEDPVNVPLYEHFGYRILGRAEIGPLTTWIFFRSSRRARERA